MKLIKRLSASLLVIFLLISVAAMPTFANPYSISIQNTNSAVSIHNTVYNAYLLFEAVENNPGGYIYNPATCLPVSYTPSGGSALSGIDLLNWIANPARTNDELYDFSIKTYNDYIDVSPAPTPSGSGTASGQQATLALTTPGLHLVTGGGERADNHSPITALTSLSDTNPTSVVNPKFDVPQIEKQVFHDDIGDYTSYSDHEIGDDIEYQIYATVPATTGYTDYSYIITDTLVDGLTYNNDLTMAINNTTGTAVLPSSYYTVTPLADGFTLTIDIMSAIEAGLLETGNTLVASFSAMLNEGAVVDPDGTNDNTVKLDYSNNPQDLISVGTTPTSVTQSSTFKVQLLKSNTAEQQLEGAEFVITLQETLTTDAYGTPTNALEFIENPTGTYTKAPDSYAGSTTSIITAGMVDILGLNANVTYYLHEITPPSGYVLTNIPTSFELQAEYNNITGDLLDGYPTMLVNGSTTPIAPTLDIINYQDRELPDTGSSAAITFFILGFILLTIGIVTLCLVMKEDNKW